MRVFAGFTAIGLLLVPACMATYAQLTESPDKNAIYVAYPKEGTKVTASSTFFVGASEPGKGMTINGAPVRKNAQGFFAHVVPLKRGTNTFVVSAADKSCPDKTLHVVRPEIVAPTATSGVEILDQTVEPKSDTAVSVGDLIILKARATPGGTMTVRIDDRAITLSPAPEVRQSRQKKGPSSKKKSGGTKKGAAGNKAATAAAAKSPSPANTAPANVNDGLAIAYGKVFQSLPADAEDLYVGFYKIQPTDRFNSSRVKFTLKKDGSSVTALAPGAVTVLTQPRMVQTSHDDTIIRVSPDKARLTPLPQGVRLMVDGWQGDNLRVLYGPGQHVYVKSEDVVTEKGSRGGSGAAAKGFISTVNISRSSYGDAVVVPLSQRLPFHIEQSLNPNKLVVKIYGATSDTDYASQQYNKAFEEGEDPPQAGAVSRPAKEPGMIDGVTWRQVSDDVYELTVKVRGNRQWGFAGSYQDNKLLVHVKNPPPVKPTADRPLAGLSICVDPGHGMPAPGSTGCSGVTEAQVNLAISLKLRKLLEAEGAKVIMTRTTDVDLDLYDRCNVARNNGADVLLSVHNNALPDGRDPWKEHGSSTYWYHPQSTELARSIKDALVHELSWPDIGARYQNLALTRPSNQLSVLAEIGFMINPDEYAQLIRPDVQDRIAQAISAGLKNYFHAGNHSGK
ncbi:MAG: N-acetylmuramoyl-L-alanine amidase [Candidatus Melainabacteria bacterium]|nr:N-acetylmuramoyl-L-alanine amidase [Candidatus Melainabacteria bacterium]